MRPASMECVRWEHLDTRRNGRDRWIITETKKVAWYLWQSRTQGAMVVLVVAVSPILFPLVVLSSILGLLAALPLLIAAAAYHLVVRNTVVQVRGTVHLLLSARWNGQYAQRHDEGTWSLNGTGDVFMAAALKCDVGDVSSTHLPTSSCQITPAARITPYEEEADEVEADPTYAYPSSTLTSVETNSPVQDRAPAEIFPLGKSFPSGEEQQQMMYSETSEALEGEPVSPPSEKTKSSTSVSGCTTENFNNYFPPDCKKRSVFSATTWPSDSSEQDFELLLSRGTACEDSASAQHDGESDLEPSVWSDSTSDHLAEDWGTRRRRWEEESTQGSLALLSPCKEDHSVGRSMFNPLFEFESTPSLPRLKKLTEGDKSPISHSPSFRSRLRKPHSTSPELRRSLTWSSSAATLSPRQLRFQECKCELQVQEKAACETCTRAPRVRVSHPSPWR